MVLRLTLLASCIVATSIAAQDKPSSPAVPFAQILECVKAADCRNMRHGLVNWYDQVRIPVIEFQDAGGALALRLSRDGALSIWITRPGDTRPSRLVSVSPEETVLSAELGRLPGDVAPQRMSPAETAQWRVKHKAYLSSKLNRPYGPFGEEFRSFWQEEADRALAAIRRQLAK